MGKRSAVTAAQPESAKKAKVCETVDSTKKDDKLSVEEAKAYFETNAVKIHLPEGKQVDISPMAGFQLKGFSKKLVKHCAGKFAKPTPVQACCWPIIMQKSDICGIARTDSGKTLAFALPYLSMSARGALTVFEQPCHTPRFVALAPTRELAMQIAEVCKDLSRAVGEAEYPVQCVYW